MWRCNERKKVRESKMQKFQILILALLLLPTIALATDLSEVKDGVLVDSQSSNALLKLQGWYESNPFIFIVAILFIISIIIIIAYALHKSQAKNNGLSNLATVALIILIGLMIYYTVFG
jgi:high-affinity K+ transport system ATPase subunit B